MHKTILLEQFANLLGNNEDKSLKELIATTDFHDIAWVIDHLPHNRRKLFLIIPPEVQSEIAIFLKNSTKESIFRRLPIDVISRFLQFNDEDDAADILQSLPKSRRNRILSKVKMEKRGKIEKLLKYGENTAGGLMDLNFIIVKVDYSFQDIAKKVQKHMAFEKNPPLVVVTEINGKLKGYIPYKNLIINNPNELIQKYIVPLKIVNYLLPNSKILEIIPIRKTDVIGVVNDNEDIIGIIHIRDLFKVISEDTTNSLYNFAGVSKEEDVFDPVSVAVRNRYKWLIINLGTAFLAAFVVTFFEDVISRYAVLAAYMPIVAGMGGNAGTQSLAIVTRGLALGELSSTNSIKVILKEAITGFLNGIIIGIIIAIILVLFNQDPMIGFILAISMVVNLVVAGFFGAFIPIFLKFLGIDPAIASTVFVTTATDVLGFLTFLGLATLLLH